MPAVAYSLVKADLPDGSRRHRGGYSGHRILAHHPDLLFNSLPRGIFLVTAPNGRHTESLCGSTTLPGFFRAFVSEDTHHA
jgi:hypothetical protein